jgi:hypothetical protein
MAKRGTIMPQYWVVGATWGGQDDQAPKFIRRGYWLLGWSDEDAPDQAQRRDQVRAGDRIAIKRMIGKGSNQIRITALGIVTEVDDEDKCVYVKWVASDLDRLVESRGCFKSIHGPFDADDPWTREVFFL